MVAMAKVSGRSSKARFAAYVEKLTGVPGHADRAGPLRDYCTGLLLPAERKSVEPMAAVTAPARVAAQHQSLLHFVANAPWSDEAMLAKVREIVLPEMTRTEPVAAWIIDDTGFPKKGRHSVGVGRQYCGQLGKQDNCQVAVSLSLANHAASLPVSYRLYLPRDGAAAAQALVGPGAASDAAAPRRAAPAGPGQGGGARPARDGVDRDRLARGHERRACLALCPDPGARRARRHPAECAARGGMAADRVARGRAGADAVLAVDPA